MLFGGVLTELFGGKPLYEKMDAHAIMYRVAVQNVMPDYSHLPDSLQRIVRCCLCPLQERSSSVEVLRMLFDL